MGPSSQTEGVRYSQERLNWVKWAGTHSALEGIDLAGVGLDLVSVLHHLLLGLAQCIIILVGGLGQVRHLKAERGPEMMQAEVGKGAWRSWLTLLWMEPQKATPNLGLRGREVPGRLPLTCTIPQLLRCS